MPHIEVEIYCSPDMTDILVAELGYHAYESFVETDRGLTAYIPKSNFEETTLRNILAPYLKLEQEVYTCKEIADQNWNEVWEQNFTHLIIDNQILIKTSFHQIEQAYPYTIIINPKMSFGTGHHETTEMMLQNMLRLPHKPQAVLDCGTGTGILAIMAALLGATTIVGTDIEEWAYHNACENIVLNQQTHIQIIQKSIAYVPTTQKFDCILANINKNVLLQEIPLYAQYRTAQSVLLLSGFYTQDLADIQALCTENGWTYQQHLTKNNWVSAIFHTL